MVNEELRREIDRLFIKGFEESLMPGIDVSELFVKERSKVPDDAGNEFFVLTVSSQLFRMFVLIHFSKNEQSESFVANALNVSASSLSDDSFYDFLGEVGNAFCGYLKRELNKTIPHLGMSTPNRLSKECLPYMKSLKTDYEQHAVAEFCAESLFYASAFLSADQELNYSVQASAVEDDSDSGELEFF